MFTAAEKNAKRYTVQDAINAAQAVLNAKYPYMKMCMNYVSKMAHDDPITLERLNEIQEEILQDSYFYHI